MPHLVQSMNIEKNLARIGFSPNEVKVYLALNDHGSQKAGKIAKIAPSYIHGLQIVIARFVNIKRSIFQFAYIKNTIAGNVKFLLSVF